ncbi:hypothetical protein PIB30_002021 [Stylosanthes scabra]|uniref:Uncharacterized protein n=1 Tax=Stylosanthes scabra TaxID=79078 RepID=A0ABU6Q2N1_9FABA|nr:hypothetical protein [Stylosanthes scabra]
MQGTQGNQLAWRLSEKEAEIEKLTKQIEFFHNYLRMSLDTTGVVVAPVEQVARVAYKEANRSLCEHVSQVTWPVHESW